MRKVFMEVVALILIAVPPALETWLVSEKPSHFHELFQASQKNGEALATPGSSVDPDTTTGEVTWELLRDSAIAPLWIDARAYDDFAKEHFPGALSLNQKNWQRNLPSVLKKRRPGTWIVIYCGGSACGLSRAIADRLRKEAGLEDVYTFREGWPALRQHVP